MCSLGLFGELKRGLVGSGESYTGSLDLTWPLVKMKTSEVVYQYMETRGGCEVSHKIFLALTILFQIANVATVISLITFKEILELEII